MAGSAGTESGRYGFRHGQVIQEFGYDDDVDDQVRADVAATTGSDLVDEDYEDVCDGTLIWWRADDGEQEDLTDLLVDAGGNLDDGGLIWVLTPKPGRPGHVRPTDIGEAAQTAGMNATSAVAAGSSWSGIKIAARSRGRR